MRWVVQDMQVNALELRLNAVLRTAGVTPSKSPSRGTCRAIEVIKEAFQAIIESTTKEANWEVSPLSPLVTV